MLYVDIPTAADVAALSEMRDPLSVSLAIATAPDNQNADAERLELKNSAKAAIAQLEAADLDRDGRGRLAALTELLDDLVDDDDFWRFQAHSLLVLATPDKLRTYRLPNAIAPMVEVSDRFDLTPLLRTLAFPNAAYVLALSMNGVRVVEVSPGLPSAEIRVDGMPKSAAAAAGKTSVGGRSYSGRIGGSEGQKVLLRQYARKVSSALEGLLAGSEVPLIIAANAPLPPMFREVSPYRHIAEEVIGGETDRMTGLELAAAARPILDGIYAAKLAAWNDKFAAREPLGRTTADLATAARAATFGAVEALLIDIDSTRDGYIDDDGKVTHDSDGDASNYSLLAEIAARTVRAGGSVLGVRADAIPGGGPLAAILRYPV